MSDIAAFLLARIAEDEEVARAASDGRWHVEVREPGVLTDETRADVLTAGTSAPSVCVVYDEAFGGCSTVDAVHIARHVPTRVLADCAAKRVIVAEHAIQDVPVLELWGEVIMSGPECRVCADWDAADMDGPPRAAGPCRTLRLLASPFADHPDFDPAWTVTA